jgi:hypothetical protein
MTREPSYQRKCEKRGFHAAVPSEDSDFLVESGLRLIQLSPTPAPSLLSTSASEPFSEASRSEDVWGESVLSFPTSTGASGGEGIESGVASRLELRCGGGSASLRQRPVSREEEVRDTDNDIEQCAREVGHNTTRQRCGSRQASAKWACSKKEENLHPAPTA